MTLIRYITHCYVNMSMQVEKAMSFNFRGDLRVIFTFAEFPLSSFL